MEHSPQPIGTSAAPFAIHSSRVITPQGEIAAAIVIENGKITQIISGSDTPGGMDCTSYGDLVISPGLVDAHVHINEPGTDWEGFETATKSAAAGGVTTLIDMPLNSLPVTTDIAALELKINSSQGKLYVDVGFHGGVVPNNQSPDSLAARSGRSRCKSVFMRLGGSSNFQLRVNWSCVARWRILNPKGIPLLAHAEIETEIQREESDDPTNYLQYANSRPFQFELTAVKLLIDLCREYQTPVHIVHLVTGEALPMIEAAKQEGLPLTVETCPHYLFFNSTNVAAGDTRFKCAPPIRDEANRLALCDAVASGLIDTIGSDHSPCPPELKQLESGDFTKAWGGIAGLQLTLPTSWTALQSHGVTLSDLAQRTATKPAEVFGLAQRKGKIEVGYDADLVVWNPDEQFLVNPDDLFHRHPVTPYESSQLQGTVERTFIRGNVAYDRNQKPQHSSPAGQTLLRNDAHPNSVAIYLDSLSETKLTTALESCCASTAWVEQMAEGGKFVSDVKVVSRAEEAASKMTESDWLEAFEAHPRIGDVDSLKKKFANTKATASNEQSGVGEADETTLNRLAEANKQYFNKFGCIFIVFATGKSAAQMLALLEQRLPNDRTTEITNAAAEQLKITLLRLRKLTQ